MDKDIAQAMDDLDDAVQVSYCRMFNNGHYRMAVLFIRNTKAVVTNRWCGSHDMEVVKKGLDLLVKYLAMERKAEQASKEV
jgi:hypothetical protein